MNYCTTLIFDNIEDLQTELAKSLNVYSVEKVSIPEDLSTISVVGKVHPALWENLKLATEEELGDFEAIDEQTKRIAHTFPMEKAFEIINTAFESKGNLEAVNGKYYYFKNNENGAEDISLIYEKIEETMCTTSAEDDPSYIFSNLSDTLILIAETLGNVNLGQELRSWQIENSEV